MNTFRAIAIVGFAFAAALSSFAIGASSSDTAQTSSQPIQIAACDTGCSGGGG